MNHINLRVKPLEGKRFTISISEKALYKDFLRRVAEKLGCKTNKVKMFMMNYNGRYINGMLGLPVDPEKSLEDNNIKSGTSFDCLVKA